MMRELSSFNIQETVLGFVVTVARGDYTNAWTARHLGEALESIDAEFHYPRIHHQQTEN